MDLDIVGIGNWGSSLAAACKNARTITRQQWPSYDDPAPIVWLCLKDRDLPRTALQLARRLGDSTKKTRVVLHSSGVLTSDVLAPLRDLRVATGSAHPWMTFPTRKAVRLRGVSFALEGDKPALAAARRLVRSFGGHTFFLAPEGKAIYHAFATLASPLLVSHLAATEKAGLAAGVNAKTARRLIGELAGATLSNWTAKGAAQSFSGAIARGDAETLALHVASLVGMPEKEIYLALARYAVEHLPAKSRDALRRALAENSSE